MATTDKPRCECGSFSITDHLRMMCMDCAKKDQADAIADAGLMNRNLRVFGTIDVPASATQAAVRTCNKMGIRPQEGEKALDYLIRSGFHYQDGAELWKPPLGPRPNFKLLEAKTLIAKAKGTIDSLIESLENLSEGVNFEEEDCKECQPSRDIGADSCMECEKSFLPEEDEELNAEMLEESRELSLHLQAFLDEGDE